MGDLMPFPYFGRKARIAHLYPYARHDTIIEPFAGSAGYALHADHWTRNVILVEADPDIAGLWRWLIDPTTTPDVIAGLPDMAQGDRLADLASGAALKLLQLSAPSDHHGRHLATAWAARDWSRIRDRVASQVHRVKHWTLIEGDYTGAPDAEATWYIDPPYQRIVHGYKNSRDRIDFDTLADWCRSRRGQVIVCEGSGADWLPFTPLSAQTTINNSATTEVWWTNESVTLFSESTP